jgi:hypothetical protein
VSAEDLPQDGRAAAVEAAVLFHGGLPDPRSLFKDRASSTTLKPPIVALLRFLLRTSPKDSDMHWWASHRTPSAADKKRPWTELKFDNGRASNFIYLSGARGRYLAERPSGVSPDQINVMEVPDSLPTDLAAYFGIYLQLAADHVTDEDVDWMKLLMKASDTLRDGYSDTYPLLTVVVSADPLADALAKDDDPVGLLAQGLQDALSVYGNFGMSGFVASELCLMAEMLQKWCVVEPLVHR